MIVSGVTLGPFQASSNVGRPTFFEEPHFQIWDKFFEYVENAPYPIAVNGVYYRMKEMCEGRQGYGGGGFAFMFWFKGPDDKAQFDADVRRIFEN